MQRQLSGCLKAVLGANVGAACADPQAEALEVNVADVVEVHRFESPVSPAHSVIRAIR
jgi:hypothetical protein